MIFSRKVRLLLDAERRVAQIGVGSPLLPSDERLLRRLEDLIARGDRETSDLFGQLLLARCQAAESLRSADPDWFRDTVRGEPAGQGGGGW
jgi:hypothetical protein